MLWRETYSTAEPDRVPLPNLIAQYFNGDKFLSSEPFILIGGFDLRAQAELGVWRRLMHSAAFDLKIYSLFLLNGVSQNTKEHLIAMTPRSLGDTTIFSDHTAEWESLIQPDRPERSFAGFVSQGFLDPLMIGIPTEEAWDRFQEHVSRFTKN